MSHNIIIANNDDYYYTVRTRKKKNKGVRIIHAPSPELKQIQKDFADWFYNRNILTFILNSQVTGFLPGKSIADNAKPHLNKEWVVNLDIKDFFPSTNDKIISNVIKDLPRSYHIKDLIKFKKPTGFKRMENKDLMELLILNGGLPQGSPASPIIANYVAIKEVDKPLIEMFNDKLWKSQGIKDLSYTRYADDITISYNGSNRGMAEYIAQRAKVKVDLGLYKIKDAKTNIKHRSQRQAVTGVIVNGDEPRIDRRLMNNMRAALYNANKNNEELTAETKGMLSFIQSINEKQYNKLTKQGEIDASN